MLTCEAAFISALVVGMSLHYHKIVQNQWYGYPEEWFPSVSSTIGDRYPERSFFQFFIAITSGALLPIRHAPFLSADAASSRPSIRACWPLVPPDSKVGAYTPEDSSRVRSLPHINLWRVDLRDLDRRP